MGAEVARSGCDCWMSNVLDIRSYGGPGEQVSERGLPETAESAGRPAKPGQAGPEEDRENDAVCTYCHRGACPRCGRQDGGRECGQRQRLRVDQSAKVQLFDSSNLDTILMTRDIVFMSKELTS